jgi:hypothetical protein
VRLSHRLRLLAAGVCVVALLAVAAGPTSATNVTPAGLPLKVENVGTVTFVTRSTPESTIACTGARINLVIPREPTNPNTSGSVITGVPTESSYIANFSGCTLNGAALSGGAGGGFNIGWNFFGATVPIPVTMSMEPLAFRFYNTFGCSILIGNGRVQSMIGRWTNGTPSTAVFTRQMLIAEATTACGIPTFDRVIFSGTFNVVPQPGTTVLVEGP